MIYVYYKLGRSPDLDRQNYKHIERNRWAIHPPPKLLKSALVFFSFHFLDLGFFCRNSMHHIELRHTKIACITVLGEYSVGMRAAYGNVKNVIDRCDEA
ncbi:hypothetical protein CMV_028310 [Castanea mollissima]|uniref:Uncharacterized protein n=1 Tax=Castanea mollissima TaxID=60419 RepID=A0A8J4Q7R2_9ROSI|nr:hypothetical protein CMV_028310 [Castanea mollissima]